MGDLRPKWILTDWGHVLVNKTPEAEKVGNHYQANEAQFKARQKQTRSKSTSGDGITVLQCLRTNDFGGLSTSPTKRQASQSFW